MATPNGVEEKEATGRDENSTILSEEEAIKAISYLSRQNSVEVIPVSPEALMRLHDAEVAARETVDERFTLPTYFSIDRKLTEDYGRRKHSKDGAQSFLSSIASDENMRLEPSARAAATKAQVLKKISLKKELGSIGKKIHPYEEYGKTTSVSREEIQPIRDRIFSVEAPNKSLSGEQGKSQKETSSQNPSERNVEKDLHNNKPSQVEFGNQTSSESSQKIKNVGSESFGEDMARKVMRTASWLLGRKGKEQKSIEKLEIEEKESIPIITNIKDITVLPTPSPLSPKIPIRPITKSVPTTVPLSQNKEPVGTPPKIVDTFDTVLSSPKRKYSLPTTQLPSKLTEGNEKKIKESNVLKPSSQNITQDNPILPVPLLPLETELHKDVSNEGDDENPILEVHGYLEVLAIHGESESWLRGTGLTDDLHQNNKPFPGGIRPNRLPGKLLTKTSGIGSKVFPRQTDIHKRNSIIGKTPGVTSTTALRQKPEIPLASRMTPVKHPVVKELAKRQITAVGGKQSFLTEKQDEKRTEHKDLNKEKIGLSAAAPILTVPVKGSPLHSEKCTDEETELVDTPLKPGQVTLIRPAYEPVLPAESSQPVIPKMTLTRKIVHTIDDDVPQNLESSLIRSKGPPTELKKKESILEEGKLKSKPTIELNKSKSVVKTSPKDSSHSSKEVKQSSPSTLIRKKQSLKQPPIKETSTEKQITQPMVNETEIIQSVNTKDFIDGIDHPMNSKENSTLSFEHHPISNEKNEAKDKKLSLLKNEYDDTVKDINEPVINKAINPESIEKNELVDANNSVLSKQDMSNIQPVTSKDTALLDKSELKLNESTQCDEKGSVNIPTKLMSQKFKKMASTHPNMDTTAVSELPTHPNELKKKLSEKSGIQSAVSGSLTKQENLSKKNINMKGKSTINIPIKNNTTEAIASKLKKPAGPPGIKEASKTSFPTTDDSVTFSKTNIKKNKIPQENKKTNLETRKSTIASKKDHGVKQELNGNVEHDKLTQDLPVVLNTMSFTNDQIKPLQDIVDKEGVQTKSNETRIIEKRTTEELDSLVDVKDSFNSDIISELKPKRIESEKFSKHSINELEQNNKDIKDHTESGKKLPSKDTTIKRLAKQSKSIEQVDVQKQKPGPNLKKEQQQQQQPEEITRVQSSLTLEGHLKLDSIKDKHDKDNKETPISSIGKDKRESSIKDTANLKHNIETKKETKRLHQTRTFSNDSVDEIDPKKSLLNGTSSFELVKKKLLKPVLHSMTSQDVLETQAILDIGTEKDIIHKESTETSTELPIALHKDKRSGSVKKKKKEIIHVKDTAKELSGEQPTELSETVIFGNLMNELNKTDVTDLTKNIEKHNDVREEKKPLLKTDPVPDNKKAKVVKKKSSSEFSTSSIGISDDKHHDIKTQQVKGQDIHPHKLLQELDITDNKKVETHMEKTSNKLSLLEDPITIENKGSQQKTSMLEIDTVPTIDIPKDKENKSISKDDSENQTVTQIQPIVDKMLLTENQLTKKHNIKKKVVNQVLNTHEGVTDMKTATPFTDSHEEKKDIKKNPVSSHGKIPPTKMPGSTLPAKTPADMAKTKKESIKNQGLKTGKGKRVSATGEIDKLKPSLTASARSSIEASSLTSEVKKRVAQEGGTSGGKSLATALKNLKKKPGFLKIDKKQQTGTATVGTGVTAIIDQEIKTEDTIDLEQLDNISEIPISRLQTAKSITETIEPEIVGNKIPSRDTPVVHMSYGNMKTSESDEIPLGKSFSRQSTHALSQEMKSTVSRGITRKSSFLSHLGSSQRKTMTGLSKGTLPVSKSGIPPIRSISRAPTQSPFTPAGTGKYGPSGIRRSTGFSATRPIDKYASRQSKTHLHEKQQSEEYHGVSEGFDPLLGPAGTGPAIQYSTQTNESNNDSLPTLNTESSSAWEKHRDTIHEVLPQQEVDIDGKQYNLKLGPSNREVQVLPHSPMQQLPGIVQKQLLESIRPTQTNARVVQNVNESTKQILRNNQIRPYTQTFPVPTRKLPPIHLRLDETDINPMHDYRALRAGTIDGTGRAVKEVLIDSRTNRHYLLSSPDNNNEQQLEPVHSAGSLPSVIPLGFCGWSPTYKWPSCSTCCSFPSARQPTEKQNNSVANNNAFNPRIDYVAQGPLQIKVHNELEVPRPTEEEIKKLKFSQFMVSDNNKDAAHLKWFFDKQQKKMDDMLQIREIENQTRWRSAPSPFAQN